MSTSAGEKLMGEAKRRKASDPNYGRSRKGSRGLVVSPPIEISRDSLFVKSASLDLQELRFALLFWDKLVWPSSLIDFSRTPDDEFLEQAGILSRLEVLIGGGSVAEVAAQTQIQAFLELERCEPGLWALAQGENSLLLRHRVLEVGRGALVELNRAIPVPDKDVPLNDILEFRQKRRDELLHLRDEIDALFIALNDAADKNFELHRRIQQIDTACADLLKVSKELGFPFRISDLKASFELRPFAALAAGAVGWALGTTWDMPIMSSALGAAMTSKLRVDMDFGMRGIKTRSNPYRYVYRFHTDLF
jgi:hypothetical protein